MQALSSANSQSKQAQGLDENKEDITYQTTFLKPMPSSSSVTLLDRRYTVLQTKTSEDVKDSSLTE